MRAAATVAAITIAALVPAACGEDEPELPGACREGAAPVVRALDAAPGAVRLPGGTSLSTCVRRARSDAELQDLGATYTSVADGLAARMPGSDRAAVRLGYLIAAVRRGARRTSGIHAELVRRLEQTVGLDGPPAPQRSAFQRGVAAGERSG
jgi:hypothetical protein